MALFDQISGLLGNLTGGNLSEQETHAHYDQLAQAVPQSTLGAAIGPVLGAMGGVQMQQSIANSVTQMTGQQKSSFVGNLLNGLGGSNVSGLLGQLGVNPAVANDPQSATPQEVAAIASHAQNTNPGLFQEATSFYSQHPMLVKALGATVIGGIASHLSQGMR